MEISITMPESNAITTHGYGVAGFGMVRALQNLGHTVPFQSADAPVEIGFCQPPLWEWSNPNAYHIGYVPWESTRIPDEWIEPMHAADEVWTTSDWCKKVFEKNGIENVRVYRHGIDSFEWTRKRRRLDEGRPVRFLHIGEPAPRKAGQLVHDTFVSTFGSDSTSASLTIKAHGYNTVIGKGAPNVRLITAELETFQMVDLIRRHDVLVYPSWGEGFGLIPLQGLVTGMPVISTKIWAPYAKHLLPELALSAKLTRSPWQEMHPGNMYEPDADALRAMMMLCGDPDEFANLSLRAYANSFGVEAEYDWLTLTRDAFAHIVEKFEN